MRLFTKMWLDSVAASERHHRRRQRRVTTALTIVLVTECIAVAVWMLKK